MGWSQKTVNPSTEKKRAGAVSEIDRRRASKGRQKVEKEFRDNHSAKKGATSMKREQISA